MSEPITDNDAERMEALAVTLRIAGFVEAARIVTVLFAEVRRLRESLADTHARLTAAQDQFDVTACALERIQEGKQKITTRTTVCPKCRQPIKEKR